ncbi:hypothetical protein Tco_0767834 [Tanacetum coccineum]
MERRKSQRSLISSSTSEMQNCLNTSECKMKEKGRMKPRRVQAVAMTIQYGVRGMILAVQSEAFKQDNVLTERLHGLD